MHAGTRQARNATWYHTGISCQYCAWTAIPTTSSTRPSATGILSPRVREIAAATYPASREIVMLPASSAASGTRAVTGSPAFGSKPLAASPWPSNSHRTDQRTNPPTTASICLNIGISPRRNADKFDDDSAGSRQTHPCRITRSGSEATDSTLLKLGKRRACRINKRYPAGAALTEYRSLRRTVNQATPVHQVSQMLFANRAPSAIAGERRSSADGRVRRKRPFRQSATSGRTCPTSKTGRERAECRTFRKLERLCQH